MKKVEEYNWEEIRDALYAYAEYVKETEPHAVNTISLFENAADECPMNEDF
jgi:hypothetical protein